MPLLCIMLGFQGAKAPDRAPRRRPTLHKVWRCRSKTRDACIRLLSRQCRQPFVRLLLQPRVFGIQSLLLAGERGQPVLQLAERGNVARAQRALLALATERPQAALNLLLLLVDRIALALDFLEPLAVRLDLPVELQHAGERRIGRLVQVAILEELAQLRWRDAAHALPAAGLHALMQ